MWFKTHVGSAEASEWGGLMFCCFFPPFSSCPASLLWSFKGLLFEEHDLNWVDCAFCQFYWRNVWSTACPLLTVYHTSFVRHVDSAKKILGRTVVIISINRKWPKKVTNWISFISFSPGLLLSIYPQSGLNGGTTSQVVRHLTQLPDQSVD